MNIPIGGSGGRSPPHLAIRVQRQERCGGSGGKPEHRGVVHHGGVIVVGVYHEAGGGDRLTAYGDRDAGSRGDAVRGGEDGVGSDQRPAAPVGLSILALDAHSYKVWKV
jgi:hypothetical protein